MNYFYHRPLSGGVLTVAYQIDENREEIDRNIVYAFAFCCPEDQFVKKTGRQKAEGRLKSKDDKYRGWATIPIDKNKSFYNQVTTFLLGEADKAAVKAKVRWWLDSWKEDFEGFLLEEEGLGGYDLSDSIYAGQYW